MIGEKFVEKTILKSEERKTRSEVVEFLQEIALKIDKGTVKLVQGEESVELSIPDNLTLEIKVEEKIKQGSPEKMQLEIELEWYVGKKKETIQLA